MPLPLFIVPVFSTLAGGLLALRLRSALGLLIALSAGLLVGAAAIDLMPEAIVLQRLSGGTILPVILLAAASFLFFLWMHRLLARWEERLHQRRSSKTWGRMAAGLLIAHSFRDGMAIGLSYAASHPAGYIVAAGIAAHDIGDGVNTVLLSTRGQQASAVDYLMLAADCLAPLAGALATGWLPLSNRAGAALLAVTAGFFLQMIVDELIPQLRTERTPRRLIAVAASAGVLLIYVATRLAA